MDMHTPHQAPDWTKKKPDEINVWQRLALSSHGIVTPANIVSVAGMIVVIIGAVRLYQGHWLSALILIALGRGADLLDGFVAQHTGTKSRLGEIVDTTCDKIGVFTLIIAMLTSPVIPSLIILPVALYHLYLALFAVIWGRQYHLHTTQYGKLAMAASWIFILAVIIDANKPDTAALVLSVASGAAFLILALASIYAYTQDLQKVAAKSKELEAWTKEVTGVLHLYNSHASNFRRAEKGLAVLCTARNWTPRRLDITKQQKDFEKFVRSYDVNKTLLVTIAGGDGTVSGVVNTLASLSDAGKLPTIYVLPLWGGNANDFSYMLNGLFGKGKVPRLLTSSRPVALPCIRLDVAERKKTKTMYACCYASFGASAFAARRLEAQRFSTSSIVRWFPPLLVLRELTFVIRALIDSPMRVAEINSRETAFYEHTLINGSRIAKVNRVPIQIDEPMFFHALVERKHPSIVVNLFRILLGRPDTVYAKKAELSFTTKQPLDAQIDGEVLHFDAETDITARIVYPKSISFISSNVSTKAS